MPGEQTTQIVIDINNHVDISGSAGTGTPQDKMRQSATQAAQSSLDKGSSTLGWMTVFKGLSRLGMSISGNSDEARQMIQSVSKAVRYANLGGRAVAGMATGDPTALFMLVTMMASDALTTAQQAAAKVAAAQNSADASAIEAGVLDISDSNVGTNWFSGRRTYNGR